MWSSVTPTDSEEAAPSARSKHSATLWQGSIYLLGGRNGNVPLKDFWRYNLAEGKWQQLKPSGDRPPCLQEHTSVAYKEYIYVFGGELGFSGCNETPLWVYDIRADSWRKVRSRKGVHVPKGRRGHTALVHSGNMLIYGGYQDLRGSTGELWAFHFETETWHLLSVSLNGKISETAPPARHKHSAVLYEEHMWVYGGMTDLQERSDLWKWDTRLKTWTACKYKNMPGPLHSHAACRLPGSMLLFGGERDGHSTNDLWKFNFDTETWEKIILDGLKPHPRAECVAFAVSEFLLKGSVSISQETRSARTRSRTSSDKTRHASYLPQNRVSPYEKTYVFQPSQDNYTDGSEQKPNDTDRTTTGFLKEISKLSQLNLSRLSHNKCNYSVLTTGNNESTESLIRHNTSLETNESTPTRMIKSKSAYQFKKKYNTDEPTIVESNIDSITAKPPEINNRITREPISVPNFTTLVLPTPVLTPVEAARLVYLDSDEEKDYEINKTEVNRDIINVVPQQGYENYLVKRGESYNSHLGYADNPLYQNIDICSLNVKFNHYPKVEEISDENSTSDYASIETVSRNTNRKDEKCNVNLFRAKEKPDGPFGFCNPNYMGPDIKLLLTGDNPSWYDDSEGKKQYAKILNTPDSVLEDNLGRSTSRHMFLEENVEMQNITNSENVKAIKNSKNTLDLEPLKNKLTKSRASSASRADTKTLKKLNMKELEKNNTPSAEVYVPIYIFIIGGKEHGQITVFKRPVSIWKLKLF